MTINTGARFASSCGAGSGACVIGMATKGGMQASARCDRSDDMTTFFRRVKWMVRRAICGLFGHDTLLQFEQHRLSLRCASCGHETTGWTISEDASRARAAARPHRRFETRHAA
jgi:hypothetical protein